MKICSFCHTQWEKKSVQKRVRVKTIRAKYSLYFYSQKVDVIIKDFHESTMHETILRRDFWSLEELNKDSHYDFLRKSEEDWFKKATEKMPYN